MAKARRYADLDPNVLRRAVILAKLPSVTRARAAARFGLSIGMLRRALTEYGAVTRVTRSDLVLHVLSDAGERREGVLGDLSGVASYLDYVNKDGSTAADIRGLLDELVAQGRIELDGARWSLVGEFP